MRRGVSGGASRRAGRGGRSVCGARVVPGLMRASLSGGFSRALWSFDCADCVCGAGGVAADPPASCAVSDEIELVRLSLFCMTSIFGLGFPQRERVRRLCFVGRIGGKRGRWEKR